ncbi:MAG: amidase [Hyphomicrobiaceae bacterium TMED74]|nr:Asp-tRNA(Asn)/Glu-tRNA(Gln) amidotransferase GatCAB subunit A [Filomicrobium sp.]RPG47474.1 MAG: amidase [Hyphomicrobiaceae bacterium TMED74]
MTDLAYLGIVEASKLFTSKELSPVELCQTLLKRIDRLDPKYHAFIRTTPELAIDAARTAEAEFSAGRIAGPMQGIPFGLKDIIDLAGIATTCHSKLFTDLIADADADVTARLKAAGGVPMGKLSTHEFALGGPSYDLPWPPAVNPWGGAHFPGGSSSGSGVAVTSGMLPAALGTDTGGSVRNPASMCSIVGMKATYGRVSRRGVFPLSYSMDHVGPMTRNVADNAALLQVLAGHDVDDPASANVEVPDFSAELESGIKGLKIGHVRHFYDGDLEAHPEMAKAVDEAAETLRQLGAEVREVQLPSLQDFTDCNRIILGSEAYAIHRHWLRDRPEDYAQSTRQRMLNGANISAADYIDALRWRSRLIAETDAVMAELDCVITASSLDPAARLDDAESLERSYPRQCRQPFNVTGQPAIAIPAGFSSDGLPLSIQIVGHAWHEARVYRVAAAYEQATNWTAQHPPGLD